MENKKAFIYLLPSVLIFGLIMIAIWLSELGMLNSVIEWLKNLLS